MSHFVVSPPYPLVHLRTYILASCPPQPLPHTRQCMCSGTHQLSPQRQPACTVTTTGSMRRLLRRQRATGSCPGLCLLLPQSLPMCGSLLLVQCIHESQQQAALTQRPQTRSSDRQASRVRLQGRTEGQQGVNAGTGQVNGQ